MKIMQNTLIVEYLNGVQKVLEYNLFGKKPPKKIYIVMINTKCVYENIDGIIM